jgi:two-component system, OmpR family, sensor kinase
MLVACLGLAGAVGATLFIHARGMASLDRVLEARLRGAGESAALLMADRPASGPELRALREANVLDDAYVVSPDWQVVASASGQVGGRVNLLRIDRARLAQAFAGQPSVGPGYAVGDLHVLTGYFSVRQRDGSVHGVLVLDAGQAFIRARRELDRARLASLALACLAALAIAAIAARWSRSERLRRESATRAARAEVLSQMAATIAHEIRNPLSVMQGTIELMRERSAGKLSERDRSAYQDLLDEIARLHQLTHDFTDLAAEPKLSLAPLDLVPLLEQAAAAVEARFPAVKVAVTLPSSAEVRGDEARLRQVFVNLLFNAAEAQGEGGIEVSAGVAQRELVVRVHNGGAPIAPDLRGRIFDPFVTTKARGTGLGLFVARRFVERHGGSLACVDDGRSGTTFELRIPAPMT